MAFSRSWGNHIKPCALTATSTYIMGKEPMYLERQGAHVSGQQGSSDWQQAPASSGQKLQNSGQSLLSGAQAKQRSRQTTLDGGLKRAASTTVERPSKSVRRLSRLADGQTSAASGQKLPSGVIGSTGAKPDRQA